MVYILEQYESKQEETEDLTKILEKETIPIEDFSKVARKERMPKKKIKNKLVSALEKNLLTLHEQGLLYALNLISGDQYNKLKSDTFQVKQLLIDYSVNTDKSFMRKIPESSLDVPLSVLFGAFVGSVTTYIAFNFGITGGALLGVGLTSYFAAGVGGLFLYNNLCETKGKRLVADSLANAQETLASYENVMNELQSVVRTDNISIDKNQVKALADMYGTTIRRQLGTIRRKCNNTCKGFSHNKFNLREIDENLVKRYYHAKD